MITFHPFVLSCARLFVGIAVWLSAFPASALEAITLQLKWSHAFQFAGYYAAQTKGYYREAGLEVFLREAGPGIDPLEAVLGGRAQYGVGTSSLLLSRKAGKPVVALAVVFQHSPLVLLVRQKPGARGTQGVHDLDGKRLMIEPQSDELIAYLKQEGISLDRLTQLPHSFQLQDLIDGRVDAMSAYVTNEPYYLSRMGLEYQTYTPRSAGIDFYGDNLFTTETEMKVHPERVRAFRAASLRGWQYAMDHPDEIIDLILANYPTQHPREFFEYEAQHMVPLMRTDLVEAGYMTRGRWRHIADTYADLGLMPADYPLDGFLYEPGANTDLTKLYVAFGLLLALVAIAAYVQRLQTRLKQALAIQSRSEAELKAQAIVDSQSGLATPLLLHNRLEHLLAGLRRHGGHGALITCCCDFASNQLQVTDITQMLRQIAREADTIASADNTIIFLLGTLPADESQAQQQANGVAIRIRDQLAEFNLPGPQVILFDGMENPDGLLHRLGT
jgi:ABC-type nitrate/sulfonate/bicarbonate transport system substrate-binding protein